MRIKDTFYTFFGRRRDQKISVSTIFIKIWSIRKTLIMWEIGGLLIGLIICFSIPKEYTATIKLVPERPVSNVEMNGISQSMLSIMMNNCDEPSAYSKKFYALLINSPDFFYDILDIKFENEYHSKITVRELLGDNLKHPWWYYISQYSLDLLETLISVKSSNKGSKFMPTRQEVDIISELQKRIMLSEVESTGMLELEVKMQDPLVAYMLADTVLLHLERFLTNYRKDKFLKKVEYTKNSVIELENNYHKLQDSLASFLDTHHNLTLIVDQVLEERIKNDRDIAFNVYSISRMEEQAAQYKLLEHKSDFVTIEATVKSSYPKKLVILSYVLFICAYIPILNLLRRDLNNEK